MGRTGARASSCSSSSSASSLPHPSLRLGLSIYTSTPTEETSNWGRRSVYVEGNDNNNNPALFVKVYIDGIPIGRKLNLLAHDGYHGLIMTLEHMFGATILWADVEIVNSARFHVLTYEDQEGDWLIVGDVPWEMFLTSVKRLKITRADRF